MGKNIMLMIGYLSNGGAERSIVNLANELSKSNNVILVVASTRKQDYKCNAKIIEVNELSISYKKFIGIYKVRKLKKKYNIDVSISYTTIFNFINVMSKYKEKTITSIRNYLSVKKEGFIPHVAHLIASFKSDYIVCCSKSVYYDQLNNYHINPKKLKVITNFCDVNLINKLSLEKIDSKYENILSGDVVISIGRLVEHKGHQHIIKAFKTVVDKNSNAKLLIFGRGKMKSELESLISNLNLENNVFLMEFDSNPYKYLRFAKCFILASKFEGFPNVIIEAMSCGIPIISTDCDGGSKEILMDNCNYDLKVNNLTFGDYGILVSSFVGNDIENKEIMLSDAILSILNSNEVYENYVRKSKFRIKKYTKDKVMKKWNDLIKE